MTDPRPADLQLQEDHDCSIAAVLQCFVVNKFL